MNNLDIPYLREGGKLDSWLLKEKINLWCAPREGVGMGEALACAGRREYCFAHIESLDREECVQVCVYWSERNLLAR